MGFLKNIFNKREKRIYTYHDFWGWFKANEKAFHKSVKNNRNLEQTFFRQLSEKLADLQEGCFFLAGMADDDTVELIFTPDGIVKNVVFVEELVELAPNIPGWKFVAMKPSGDIEKFGIRMQGYSFVKEKLYFTPISDKSYPDEINLKIVFSDYNSKDKSTIENGIFIFLDNYLGEMNIITMVDNIEVAGNTNQEEELIPISKLQDFLIWRKKEFIEKYEGTRHNTEDDAYSTLEATLDNGRPWVGIVNTALTQWEAKASHPWILKIGITYDGSNSSGMPDGGTGNLMNSIEDEIMEELRDSEGYLNIGRETGNDIREIYIACRDFRKPSKVMSQIAKKYSGKIDLDYEIFKDKYWKSLDHFSV